MLACHHQTPRRVAYAVRVACDNLAQLLSAHLQSALAIEKATRIDGYSEMRSRLVEAIRNDADMITVLKHETTALAEAFTAHAVVMTDGIKIHVHGELNHEAAVALVHWLEAEQDQAGPIQAMRAEDTLAAAPDALQQKLAGWAGVLALPFGEAPFNWVVMLRKEEIETIRWGGKPEKVYKAGPSGPRLTPRGSFDLWEEIVRGKSVPWSGIERDNAQRMLDDLMRADAIHAAKGDKAKGELLSMLGSDLQSPLLTILQTAEALKSSGMAVGLGDRLQVTGVRIQRLVDQAIHLSRMKPGAVLKLQTQRVDLAALLRQLSAEAQEIYPRISLQTLVPPALTVNADPERLAHAIHHLIENAVRHALLETPILVELRDVEGAVVLEVSNESTRIDPTTAERMFLPKTAGESGKRTSVGLSIAHLIVENHGGSLSYTYADPYVVFSIVLPVVSVPRDGQSVSPELPTK